MNLTSCDKCGVVLDKDKLNFPDSISSADGSIDDAKAVWVNGEFLPYVKCLVCGGDIVESST